MNKVGIEEYETEMQQHLPIRELPENEEDSPAKIRKAPKIVKQSPKKEKEVEEPDYIEINLDSFGKHSLVLALFLCQIGSIITSCIFYVQYYNK